MREYNSHNHELGHWEVMQLSAGISQRVDMYQNALNNLPNPDDYNATMLKETIKSLRDLQRIFQGHSVYVTVTVKEL